ncbi:MAG: DUF935 family protein [Verrucomicrobia bacterium]|nr:DUF935 family protein [Verrucomicrobiota bacterium]
MSTPLHIAEINRARDYYNPMIGLTMPRLVRLFDEAERGRYDELQKLNRVAEKRHPTLRALKSRRLSALKELDWSVKAVAELPRGATAAQADAQALFLQETYAQIENLPQAAEFLALATFRGFAHLEPRHRDDDPSQPITRLVPVPQWHWGRDPATWQWRYDPAARGDSTTSVVIEPADFIIREIDDPLCEIALTCLVRRLLATRDWSAFMADYGIPSIFAMLGENTPLDKVKEWLEVMKEVTGNSRGALPPGSSVETLELSKLDGAQFLNFINQQDQELVLAGTGGMLTMLTANTGLGGDSQSGAHEDTFDAIALAEAREISAIFQAQFDARLLARDFPGQPVLAYFELVAEDEEDVSALADRVAKLYTAGLEADPGEIGEKVGLTLTRKAAPAAVPGAPMPGDPAPDPAADPLKNRISDGRPLPAAISAGNEARFLSGSERQLAAADLATLAPVIALVKPVRAELARLAEVTDDAEFTAGLDALRPALNRLQTALPELEKEVLTGRPDLEEAFSDIIGTAYRSGLEEAAASRKIPAKKGAKTR